MTGPGSGPCAKTRTGRPSMTAVVAVRPRTRRRSMVFPRDWLVVFKVARILASKYPLAYRPSHAIEIKHMGGGLFAPLPDRGDLRRRAQARRGGSRRSLCHGGFARRQR